VLDFKGWEGGDEVGGWVGRGGIGRGLKQPLSS